ncbi:MAG: sigma factor-like helix-turn-helix DNA-binding protein [Planctomycetota bacterium]
MMLNHYNRRSRYQEILEDVRHQQPEDVVSEQLIAGLTEDRGDYFVERTGVDFAEGLRLLGEWEASSEIELRDRAAAMRYRYIDGFGYDQIAQQMRIGRGEVENLLERAKYHLRKRDQR